MIYDIQDSKLKDEYGYCYKKRMIDCTLDGRLAMSKGYL